MALDGSPEGEASLSGKILLIAVFCIIVFVLFNEEMIGTIVGSFRSFFLVNYPC